MSQVLITVSPATTRFIPLRTPISCLKILTNQNGGIVIPVMGLSRSMKHPNVGGGAVAAAISQCENLEGVGYRLAYP